MRDSNQIVGELRVFLQSVDRTEQPRMADLASDYASACVVANERLNRCAAFLRQGLRSEAIHLAKAEPDLLDMVTVLDFPERAEWDELTLMYNWPKAPAVAIGAAQAINEAYALEHPLEDLLRTHRRLALVRAPLPVRLETMRKISLIDLGNPMWAEDIDRFERVRQGQIEKQIRVARGDIDATVLEAVARELETTDWVVPPPESLMACAREALTHVKQEGTRRELRTLLGPLHQARATKDPILARQLRTRWLSLTDRADLPPYDPLFGQVLEVMDWLQQEDQKEERARDLRSNLEDLEQAIAARAGRGGSDAFLSAHAALAVAVVSACFSRWFQRPAL
jgi:hypothetical protein